MEKIRLGQGTDLTRISQSWWTVYLIVSMSLIWKSWMTSNLSFEETEEESMKEEDW